MRLLEIPIEVYDTKEYNRAKAINADAEPVCYNSIMTVDLDKILSVWKGVRPEGGEICIIDHGHSTTTVLMPYEDLVNKWIGPPGEAKVTGPRCPDCNSGDVEPAVLEDKYKCSMCGRIFKQGEL